MWALVLLLAGCNPDAEIVDTGTAPDCAPGEKRGGLAGSDDRRTPDGLRYTVRVPETYEATVAHPLVVVYAPAGGGPEITESFTGLTVPLTQAGFLVAYADHASPSNEAAFRDLGTIPGRVARRWCVDEESVHFTGHSDGGSMASILAIMPELASIPATSIAPSAAGVNAAFLAGQTCPPALPVMVMHSSRDALFPGFGREAGVTGFGEQGDEV